MDEKQVSETLGLTERETQVYLALAEKRQTNAGELIKVTGMYRAAVYDILERLIEKGLIGYVKIGSVREFNIIPLSIVRQNLESEKENLQKKEQKLQELEKYLEQSNKKSEPEVAILKGKKGLKAILNHILETGREWHVFGAQGNFKALFPEEHSVFHAKRVRKKIFMKIIYYSKGVAEKRLTELPLVEIRHNNRDCDTPATTFVYGDYVAIVLWSNPVYITWIKSKDVAKSYEHHFQMLWKHAKK